jgi:hypothetical protein
MYFVVEDIDTPIDHCALGIVQESEARSFRPRDSGLK